MLTPSSAEIQSLFLMPFAASEIAEEKKRGFNEHGSQEKLKHYVFMTILETGFTYYL